MELNDWLEAANEETDYIDYYVILNGRERDFRYNPYESTTS